MNMTATKQDEAQPGPGLRVRLKPGREKPLLRGSTWVFSGALDEVDGAAPAGTPADVFDYAGDWLGRGLWHPAADLSVRLLTRDPREEVNEAFFRRQIRQSVQRRHRLFGPPESWQQTNAFRLVFSEADGLSGLIADQYAGTVALQVGSKVWEPWLSVICDELRAAAGASGVVMRADADAVKREGLPETLGGDAAPESVRIRENGLTFEVALAGQKTGFYLDQRDNRRKVAAYARDRDVLSAYCYTGAFEVLAAHAGARSIRGWDSSGPALAQFPRPAGGAFRLIRGAGVRLRGGRRRGRLPLADRVALVQQARQSHGRRAEEGGQGRGMVVQEVRRERCDDGRVEAVARQQAAQRCVDYLARLRELRDAGADLRRAVDPESAVGEGRRGTGIRHDGRVGELRDEPRQRLARGGIQRHAGSQGHI